MNGPQNRWAPDTRSDIAAGWHSPNYVAAMSPCCNHRAARSPRTQPARADVALSARAGVRAQGRGKMGGAQAEAPRAPPDQGGRLQPHLGDASTGRSSEVPHTTASPDRVGANHRVPGIPPRQVSAIAVCPHEASIVRRAHTDGPEAMDESASQGVFLSYRREDTRHVAGRLYERLTERFGQANVFMDVDSIEPGLGGLNRWKQLSWPGGR